METITFELAPRSRLHDWDKAIAFSIAPAAPTFAAVYFYTDDLALATVVTTVCIVGMLICGFTLSSTSLGRVTLTKDALRLDSGFLHATVPLGELDLAAARLGSAPGADLRLATKATHSVTIPRRVGPSLVVTPLDRDGFLRTIRQLVPAA
jgi:hypothetical protein